MGSQKHFAKLSPDDRQLIALRIVKAISSYLQLFISPVVVRRIISALLIVAGIHSTDITELTGLSERGIRDLKNQLLDDNIDSLFEIKSGRGRKSKLKDIEKQIIEETEKGNYQTLQQIADMVKEKYGISVSIMAISRLLKKTKSIS